MPQTRYLVERNGQAPYYLPYAYDKGIWNDDTWLDEVRDHGGYDYPLLSPFEDLGNDIHPLFRSMMDQPGWLPALQHASKHLQEPALMPFWHALLCRDPELLDAHSNALGVPMYQIRDHFLPITPQQVAETQQALVDASRHIFWSCAPHPKDTSPDHVSLRDNVGDSRRLYFRGQDLHGVTMLVPRDHPSFDLPAGCPHPPGFATMISISYCYAHALRPESPWTGEEKLRLSYSLSRTLLHEVTHGLFEGRFPPTFRNPFMNSPEHHEPFVSIHRETELGRGMEMSLFGGTIETMGLNSRPNGCAILITYKWPDTTAKSTGGTTKGQMYLGRGKPKPWDTIYIIPIDFIQRQFTRKFWEDDIPRFGDQALRAPKSLGLRRYNIWWKDGDDFYDSDDSSVEMHEDDDYIVREGQPERPDHLKPLGHELGKGPFPDVHHIYQEYPAGYVTLVPPAPAEFTWRSYNGQGPEPMVRCWRYPLFFKAGPGGLAVVDETLSSPWYLSNEYFVPINDVSPPGVLQERPIDNSN